MSKPSNPKDAVGIKKVPMSCVPAPVIMEVALAMMEGALKYGRHNYRAVGVRASVYYDAFMRHAMAFWEGEDNAPDSGVAHLAHMIACCVVLRDSQMRGNWIDDRPPKSDPEWLLAVNAKAEALTVKYPNPVRAYTQVDQSWAEAAAEKGDGAPTHA